MGKPYTVTRSRLGAITKVYAEQYVCDLQAIKELIGAVGEKLHSLPERDAPKFSLLISYSDSTHHDGVPAEIFGSQVIATGKTTDRVVMHWSVQHQIDGAKNDLAITVRISNPGNPLMFLQAALSKSPRDIDNFEFEMGPTCVTVDGATQAYADEVFMRVQSWVGARAKPYPFVTLHESFLKFQWITRPVNHILLPTMLMIVGAAWSYRLNDVSIQISVIPVLLALFIVARDATRKLNERMERWALRAAHIGLFQITSGDVDSITKTAAKAKGSVLKLCGSVLGSFVVNLAAGVACWYYLPGANPQSGTDAAQQAVQGPTSTPSASPQP
jgi:hypothetical protein